MPVRRVCCFLFTPLGVCIPMLYHMPHGACCILLLILILVLILRQRCAMSIQTQTQHVACCYYIDCHPHPRTHIPTDPHTPTPLCDRPLHYWSVGVALCDRLMRHWSAGAPLVCWCASWPVGWCAMASDQKRGMHLVCKNTAEIRKLQPKTKMAASCNKRRLWRS
jgi:hypothetical protein